MTRRLVPFLLAAALLAPRAASATVSLEAFYGITRPPSADFSTAVSGAANDPHLMSDSLNIAGGNVLLHLGLLELGGIFDVSWKGGSASQTAIGALVGVGGDMGGALRLELLGEVGGHRYGNFVENPDVVTASSSSEWLAYVGLRPGLAYRFDLGGSGLLVGIWAFVRWDLSSSNVPVTVRSAPSERANLEVGGATIGAVARVGLDF
jgi:hypothetical protein